MISTTADRAWMSLARASQTIVRVCTVRFVPGDEFQLLHRRFCKRLKSSYGVITGSDLEPWAAGTGTTIQKLGCGVRLEDTITLK